MKYWIVLYFIWLLLFNLHFVFSIKLSLKIMEETPINSEIINIIRKLPANMQNKELTYVSESKYFNVSKNGKLTVTKKIDLENLCMIDKECCGVQICKIHFTLFVTTRQQIMENLEIVVDVLDKNDRKPKFEKKTQEVKLSEYTNKGTRISLKEAKDDDFSKANKIQKYKLFEPTNTFKLDVSNLPSISLIVLRNLDHEKVSKYQAELKACDPENCVTQNLTIFVEDENDNQPIFSRDAYFFTIKEDIRQGDIIGKVMAKDRDSGKNGHVTYQIGPNSDADLRATFSVDAVSGYIKLNQILSTDTRVKYEFRIEAKDGGKSNPKKAVCKVTIIVEDVNNHAPNIKQLVAPGGLRSSDKMMFEIPENNDTSYVVTLRVVDLDKGDNAKIFCWLEPQSDRYFKLQKNTKIVYTLLSRHSFDHEVTKQFDVKMICKDFGVPALKTEKTIPIKILDVNEYRPRFTQAHYDNGEFYLTVSIRENSRRGTFVTRINTTDDDGSAVLRYKLDKLGKEFFEINPSTGIITCGNKMLDRENQAEVIFTVYVTDSLKNPNTESMRVRVTVLDANDHSPVFDSKMPQFAVIENTPKTKLQDRIRATDLDSGVNQNIIYSLLNTWNARTHQRADSLFSLSSDGYLETNRALDREMCDLYRLEIAASDQAEPPLDSPRQSRINVTLRVLDENDNSPVWTYPSLDRQKVYNITDSMKPGAYLIALKAQDKDLAANKDVRYQMKSQSLLQQGSHKNVQFFSINKTTGQLSVSQTLQAGEVTLTIQAYDLGRPRQYSDDLDLTININIDQNSFESQQQSARINLTIISVMITVTVLVFLFLVIAICCVWRRPTKPPKYLVTTTTTPTKPAIDQTTLVVAASPPDPVAFHWMSEHNNQSLAPSVIMDEETGSVSGYTHQLPSVGSKSPYYSRGTRGSLLDSTSMTPIQLYPYNTGHIHDPIIDGDSGDSGKGPSEEGANYFTLRQPISKLSPNSLMQSQASTTFRGQQTPMNPMKNPHSPNDNQFSPNMPTQHPSNQFTPLYPHSRSITNSTPQYYVLPENSTTSQLQHTNYNPQYPTQSLQHGYNAMSLPRYHGNKISFANSCYGSNLYDLGNYGDTLKSSTNNVINENSVSTFSTCSSPKVVPHHLKLTPMHLKNLPKNDDNNNSTLGRESTATISTINTISNSSTKTVISNNHDKK